MIYMTRGREMRTLDAITTQVCGLKERLRGELSALMLQTTQDRELKALNTMNSLGLWLT